MLHRRSGFDTDESLARELVLWVNNDYQTYRQLEQIQRNMTHKLARDNFDPEMAIKGFMWATEAGAKSYAREFSGVWHEIFPIGIRRLAAEMLRDEFLAEVDAAPQSFKRHVFKKDAPKWRERYPRDAEVRVGTVQQEEFDGVLEELLDEESDVLGIPGVYEVLFEHFNNDVLDYAEAEGREFDEVLTWMVQNTNGAELLCIPGFYEIAAKALNSDVLKQIHYSRTRPRRNAVTGTQYGDYVEGKGEWLSTWLQFGEPKGRRTFVDEPDDIAWLLDTHLPGLLDDGYKSAIIYGNEDSPDYIELYWARDPTIADTSRVFERIDASVW